MTSNSLLKEKDASNYISLCVLHCCAKHEKLMTQKYFYDTTYDTFNNRYSKMIPVKYFVEFWQSGCRLR